MKNIVLFDGDCNFCNKSVQFILKRDPTGYFSFTSLQGSYSRELLERYEVKEQMASFILVEDGVLYEKSTAALRVCKKLTGLWRFFSILLLVPKPLRDFVYDFVAKNRYAWFGNKDRCILLSKEEQKRFL